MRYDRSGCVSRRSILAGLGAIGAGLAVPPRATLARPVKPAQRKNRGVIDMHHHFWAPEYLKVQIDWENAHHVGHFPAMMAWKPEASIAEMDRGGVKTSVLSLASISEGLWGLDAQAATQLVRACDDYAVRVMSDYPGRFGLFAPVNMIQIDTSLKEIEYGYDQCHADGVGLQSSYNGKYLGDPFYVPILQELNRRNAVAFVHGANCPCCSQIKDGPGMFGSVVEVTFDVTRTAASLLTSGALRRYPNIRWVIAYGGGVLPFVAGRMEAFLKSTKNIQEIAPDGVAAELQKLYVDTVNVTDKAAMTGMLNFTKPSRIVYGSDFPYFNNSQLDAIDARNLPASTRKAILSGNAERLIPRLMKT